MFVITDNLTNAAHRFMTKASNCIRGLVVNNASVYNSAYIVQGDTGVQWSDQWLIERVNGNTTVPGVRYASKNYNHRLATYPDFDFYSTTDTQYYESTNFVSQCLTASGHNYYRTGTYSDSDWWYVNKMNHVQNQYFDYDDLTDNGTITSSWYDPVQFKNFWVNIKNKNTCIVEDAYYICNGSISTPELQNKFCYCGDVLLVKQTVNGVDSIKLVLYAAEFGYQGGFGDYSSLKNCDVYLHSDYSNLNSSTLGDVLKYLGAKTSHNISVEIIHMV